MLFSIIFTDSREFNIIVVRQTNVNKFICMQVSMFQRKKKTHNIIRTKEKTNIVCNSSVQYKRIKHER